MGTSRFMTFIICLVFASNLLAEDTNVQSLSEGACWYEEGEFLKIASFNDRESLLSTRDEIESQVEDLFGAQKRKKAKTSDLSLHCGGYGSSLVVKTEVNERPACLWLKLNKGKLEVRSLGGLETTKSGLCDGYKWGELIVGLKSLDQKSQLESGALRQMIKSITVVSGTTLKVLLKDEFHGKEEMVLEEFKKELPLRYVELNFYQHPVGEATSLKN